MGVTILVSERSLYTTKTIGLDYYSDMVVIVSAENEINFTIAAALIRLHTSGGK